MFALKYVCRYYSAIPSNKFQINGKSKEKFFFRFLLPYGTRSASNEFYTTLFGQKLSNIFASLKSFAQFSVF